MKTIAHIRNGFESKFGIPRQGGIAKELTSEIIFEKEYRNPEAFRGLDGYSHIWLIWNFSESERKSWSPTVRPPRLGGNKRMGVFATRSPFRPNPIGLSAVKLEEIRNDPKLGMVLVVSGADLMNGTPIYDIKPYLPEFDSIADASGGFAEQTSAHTVRVECRAELEASFPEISAAAKLLLSEDPKPAYLRDLSRIYGMKYSSHEIKFKYTDSGIAIIDILKET